MSLLDDWGRYQEVADGLVQNAAQLSLANLQKYQFQNIPERTVFCQGLNTLISLREQGSQPDLIRTLSYSFFPTEVGEVLIASYADKICFFGFVDVSRELSLKQLEASYSSSPLKDELSSVQVQLLAFLSEAKPCALPSFEVSGTAFQIKVWRALLNLQEGEFISYSDLANRVGVAKGSRAVATAVGRNPLAYFIPCHRIVQRDGGLGGYRWGLRNKISLILAELAPDE